MACTGVTNICVDSTIAKCVDYEGALGANTKITDDCVNQSEVNEDLYAIVDEVITGLDISGITSTCLTIPANVTPAQFIKLLADKVCELDTEVTALQSINYSTLDITGFGLTIPTCIADSCANPPTTLAEWMQVMMDERNCT